MNKVELGVRSLYSVHELLQANPYTDERGLGIVECSIDSELLSATLVKRNATTINGYNEATREIEKTVINIFSEIVFYIDSEFGLLYANGPNHNLTQVKAYFKELLGNENFITEPTNLTPFRAYTILRKEHIQFDVSELCIGSFNYKNGAIGRFTAKIFEDKVARELIENYTEECNRIILLFSTDDIEFRACVYSNNSIGIITEPEDASDNFHYFKQLIF